MAVGPTSGSWGQSAVWAGFSARLPPSCTGLIVHAASILDGAQGPLHGKVQATPPGSPGMTPPAAPRPATLLVARRLWVGRTLGPRRTEILYPFPKSRIFRVSHVIVKPETLPALQASSQAWAPWLLQGKAGPSPFHSPAPLSSGLGAHQAQGGQRGEGPPSPCPTPPSPLLTGRAAAVALAGSEPG